MSSESALFIRDRDVASFATRIVRVIIFRWVKWCDVPSVNL